MRWLTVRTTAVPSKRLVPVIEREGEKTGPLGACMAVA